MELFICIKRDLALNNLPRLICHKTQKTNLWQHPCQPTPNYLSFLKPNYSWPVIRLVVFYSFPTKGITHFFTDTQSTTERLGEKNKRINTDLGRLQAQERGICVPLLCSFLCICRLEGMYFAQNFYKDTWNANLSLTVFSHCLLLPTVLPWTAISNQLLFSALLCQLALIVFSGTFLPASTSGLTGDLAPSPLCGFRAKTDKEIVWVAPTQTETNCYASCHKPTNQPDKYEEVVQSSTLLKLKKKNKVWINQWSKCFSKYQYFKLKL